MTRAAAPAAALTLAAALAAALLSGCARRGVIADGWAPLGPDGEAGARQRAIAQAQRAAVEREAGVALSSRVRVENGAAVEQSLTAKAAGRIERYEVVSARAEDGGVRARIRAVVADGPAPPSVELSLGEGLPEELADGAREGLATSGVAVAESGDLRLEGRYASARGRNAAGWPAWRARVRLVARRGGVVVAQATADAAAAAPEDSWARSSAIQRAARACAQKLAGDLLAAR